MRGLYRISKEGLQAAEGGPVLREPDVRVWGDQQGSRRVHLYKSRRPSLHLCFQRAGAP